MADNYLKTAERMYDSSRLLHKQSHFHNACYLSGYVAECYLKIMVQKTPTITTPLYGKQGLGHNIHRINSELHYAISSSTVTPSLFRAHLLDMPIDCPKIYNQWNPLSRYDDATGWDNFSESQYFQDEQDKCFEKITEMYVSNLIS